MRHVLGLLVPFAAAVCFAPALPAEVDVTTTLKLTKLTVTASPGTTVQLSLTASAFGAVQDSLGGFDFGFDPGPNTASASAATALANWAGAADNSSLTASAASGVKIPGKVPASAGTVPGGNFGDLAGTLDIMDSTGMSNPVTVNFSATITSMQDLMTDQYGLKATSETIFTLLVNGSHELFRDAPQQIGSSTTLSAPFSGTLMHSDSTLLTNTVYSFEAQVDAESFGVNTPEPSFLWPTASLGLIFLVRRIRRA